MHVDEIGLLAKAETQAELEAIWPRLCESANVRLFAMPPVEQAAGSTHVWGRGQESVGRVGGWVARGRVFYCTSPLQIPLPLPS